MAFSHPWEWLSWRLSTWDLTALDRRMAKCALQVPFFMVHTGMYARVSCDVRTVETSSQIMYTYSCCAAYLRWTSGG